MKVLTGKVMAIGKIPQTVTVEVENRRPHPLYRKMVRRTRKFLVAPDKFAVKVGDQVKIGEVRPISKNKYFKILEVIK